MENKRNNKLVLSYIKEMELSESPELTTLIFLSAFMTDDMEKRINLLNTAFRLSGKSGVNLYQNLNIKRTRIIDNKSHESDSNEVSDLAETDLLSQIDPRDILDTIASFGTQIGMFDDQEELDSLLSRYQLDLSTSGNPLIKEMSKNLKFSVQDYNYQYAYGDQKPGEAIANVAWLANKMAHFFEEAQEKGLIHDKMFPSFDFKEFFMSIKNYSMHEIIKAKKNGENVRLAIIEDPTKTKNDKFKNALFIALPEYFQPIILHYPKGEFTPEELAVCNDRDDFSYDVIYNISNSPTMPLKLDVEKESLLDYIYQTEYKYRTEKNPDINKLDWYFSHNKPRKLLRSPKPKIRRDLKSFESEKKEEKKKKKRNRLNKKFLTDLFEKYDIPFPDYLQEHFIEKTNYLNNDFAKKVKSAISHIETKKGNSYFDVNKISEEIFPSVYISMLFTKPMATLSKAASTNPKLLEAVKTSIDDRKKVVEFLKNNVENFSDFKKIKSALKAELTDTKEQKQTRQEIIKLNERLNALNNKLTEMKRNSTELSKEEADLKAEIDEILKQLTAHSNIYK